MRDPVNILTLAASDSGAESWADFLASFRRTAADQLDMLPAVGFVILVVVMLVLNWKIAKRLARRSARGRPSRQAQDPPDDHRRAA